MQTELLPSGELKSYPHDTLKVKKPFADSNNCDRTHQSDAESERILLLAYHFFLFFAGFPFFASAEPRLSCRARKGTSYYRFLSV